MNFNKEVSKEIFKKFFELTGSFVSRKVFNHSMNFRTAKRKDKLLDETVMELKSVGIRMSKNDLINLCIDIVLGIKQHGENPHHFYFSKNEETMINFINNNREELITMVQTRLFEKQMELLSSPSKNSKEKRLKRQEAKRIGDKMNGIE